MNETCPFCAVEGRDVKRIDITLMDDLQKRFMCPRGHEWQQGEEPELIEEPDPPQGFVRRAIARIFS